MSLVLVVHGGGGSNISTDRKERMRQGIARAATEGYNILKEGGSAVDAVEGAVAVLENDPEFNAGCGSVLNVNGDVEMDASIMDGKNLSAGAVSAVRCIANPIKLARLVMEKTPHCFLTGHGAEKFAADMGVPEIPVEKLITERSKKHLEKEKQEKGAEKPDCPKNTGTVGAVAMDCNGNLAYATSTGGIVNKMIGRVGDSPCIGKTAEEAAELALNYMKSKLKGLGGLILISKTGDWVAKWTSVSMPWAAAKDDKLQTGIDFGDTKIVDLP
ncbi:isoaspartyl peptidase/L-asparaginase isoform X1 [Nannospalax galili]|uniref:isoaspartyl peptidase/L-asparaginase isoform X1 n=1 Tax=Nannospalax galili TaxID=1026970 RepID=UPI0004ED63AA|nr:isoaspartyl peptidase/L-asparaginase isoform X1 [Nannospalax galili]